MKKSIMKFILFLLRNRKHDKPARVQKCNLTEQVNRFLQNSYLFRMPRSPCPGNSMLGQRYQPFSFLQTCT